MTSQLHPLPFEGPLTFDDLQQEKLWDSLDVNDMENITEALDPSTDPELHCITPLNQFSDPHTKIEVKPYEVASWYGYNHLATGTGYVVINTINGTIYNLEGSGNCAVHRPDESLGQDIANSIGESSRSAFRDIEDSGELAPVVQGLVGVGLVLSGITIFDSTTYQVRRSYLKFSLAGINLSTIISGITITIESSAFSEINYWRTNEYTGGSFVLVHFRETEINRTYWGDIRNMGLISVSPVSWSEGTLEWTLNATGIARLKEQVATGTDLYFRVGILEYNYDYLKNYFLGVNRVIGRDADFESVTDHWVYVAESQNGGSGPTLTKAYDMPIDRKCMRLQTDECSVGYLSLPISNLSPTGLAHDDFVLVGFEYYWADYPDNRILDITKKQHFDIDTQHFGCGFFDKGMFKKYALGPGYCWGYALRAEVLSGTKSDALKIYGNSDYSSSANPIELLIDNFHLSKFEGSYQHWQGSAWLTNPKMTITYSVPGLATVSTATITTYTNTTFNGGGYVSSSGGASVTETGIVWGTTTGPTIATNKQICGEGSGTFGGTITGLTTGVLYYVRAYATNSIGTAYGNEVTVTLRGIPILPTTNTATNVVTSPSPSGAPWYYVAFDTGGTLSSDGGYPLTHWGFIYSRVNPNLIYSTAEGGVNLDVAYLPVFESPFYYRVINRDMGETGYTTIYFRSFAQNSYGYGYGPVQSLTPSPSQTLPTVTTTAISSIAYNSASSGGDVTSDNGYAVSARGICWNTSVNPTTANSTTSNGTGTGAFTSSITGLSALTTYHVRAYATNSYGTSYGVNRTFTTIENPATATVTTVAITSIAKTTASSGGNTIQDGGTSITAKGVCWGTSTNPTTAGSKTTDGTGTGSFSSSITSLTAATIYYVRAYITNSISTYYGANITFTTLPNDATVSTSAITNLGKTSAAGGGNSITDGGGLVSNKGICWNTSTLPTVANNKTTGQSGNADFSGDMTGLTASTLYHVRAYVTNESGTFYGNEVDFTTTSDTVPVVTTYNPLSITNTTLSAGGNVTDTGGATVTAKGVCYSTTNTTPTIVSDTVSAYGSGGLGSFFVNITTLTAGATYYFRAYATSSNGTGYGVVKTIVMLTVPLGITLVSPFDITSTGATSGGGISSDGGSPITQKGVCWKITTGPTTSDSKTTNGTGVTSFASTISGLSASTHYYVRAYATNMYGTSYSSELDFTSIGVGLHDGVLATPQQGYYNNVNPYFDCNILDFGNPAGNSSTFCISTSHNPTTANSYGLSGFSGGALPAHLYSQGVEGLVVGTTYYIRFYFNYSTTWYAYSPELTYVHKGVPTLTQSTPTISAGVVTGHGNITSASSGTIYQRGFEWDTRSHSSPDTDPYPSSYSENSSSTGAYNLTLSGTFSNLVNYYIRARAVNQVGVGHSNELVIGYSDT